MDTIDFDELRVIYRTILKHGSPFNAIMFAVYTKDKVLEQIQKEKAEGIRSKLTFKNIGYFIGLDQRKVKELLTTDRRLLPLSNRLFMISKEGRFVDISLKNIELIVDLINACVFEEHDGNISLTNEEKLIIKKILETKSFKDFVFDMQRQLIRNKQTFFTSLFVFPITLWIRWLEEVSEIMIKIILLTYDKEPSVEELLELIQSILQDLKTEIKPYISSFLPILKDCFMEGIEKTKIREKLSEMINYVHPKMRELLEKRGFLSLHENIPSVLSHMFSSLMDGKNLETVFLMVSIALRKKREKEYLGEKAPLTECVNEFCKKLSKKLLSSCPIESALSFYMEFFSELRRLTNIVLKIIEARKESNKDFMEKLLELKKKRKELLSYY